MSFRYMMNTIFLLNARVRMLIFALVFVIVQILHIRAWPLDTSLFCRPSSVKASVETKRSTRRHINLPSNPPATTFQEGEVHTRLKLCIPLQENRKRRFRFSWPSTCLRLTSDVDSRRALHGQLGPYRLGNYSLLSSPMFSPLIRLRQINSRRHCRSVPHSMSLSTRARAISLHLSLFWFARGSFPPVYIPIPISKLHSPIPLIT
ncbi:hypothetical protein BYT27DRAFT_6430614 [Phlegmacium glaucopus]|nr:hypothetical protein BYT27DRAFT_6430614 [Phlegmacium glaucopus]